MDSSRTPTCLPLEAAAVSFAELRDKAKAFVAAFSAGMDGAGDLLRTAAHTHAADGQRQDVAVLMAVAFSKLDALGREMQRAEECLKAAVDAADRAHAGEVSSCP